MSACAPDASVASAEEKPRPSLLGECRIHLSHPTFYEPPLYLFPELLPRVAEGSPATQVWDRVATAIQVKSSYWKIADASPILSEVAAEGVRGESAGGKEEKPQAPVSLASLIAASRLVGAGLAPQVLEDGRFSSAVILAELARLQRRLGLSDAEGAALFTQHFINLLAWKALHDINHPIPPFAGTDNNTNNNESNTTTNNNNNKISGSGTTDGSAVGKRKRARENGDGGPDVDLLSLRPCPDPWDDIVNDSAHAGTFISGKETNVEERVALIRTLTELYRRPVKSLASEGVQTDLAVPPGRENPTSPYVDAGRLPGSTLRVRDDLGWVPAASAEELARYTVCVEVSLLDSQSPSETHCLSLGSHAVGCVAGQEGEIAVAKTPATVPLAINVAHLVCPHGQGETTVSPHHCTLLVQAPADKQAAHHVDSDAAASAGQVVLLNYSRNGSRVEGRRWVLEEPCRLSVGDRVILGGRVVLRVCEGRGGAAAAAAKAEPVELTPVKTEVAE